MGAPAKEGGGKRHLRGPFPVLDPAAPRAARLPTLSALRRPVRWAGWEHTREEQSFPPRLSAAALGSERGLGGEGDCCTENSDEEQNEKVTSVPWPRLSNTYLNIALLGLPSMLLW